ncbi:MAG: glycosyltransferase 87 family protein [Terracidiphilus sp.]
MQSGDGSLSKKDKLPLLSRSNQVTGVHLLWFTGWVATATSVMTGLLNSVRYSQDFQWSPTRLLLHHIDPWREALAGNPSGSLILSQGPNYAHFLYLLMAPLGAMSFPVARVIWAVCNVCFACLTLWLVKQMFQQTKAEWGVTCVAFLCGTSFRNDLHNGQQALLVLVLVTLAYSARKTWPQCLWFGLSYCKYSFSPPYFFDLVFSRPVGFVIATFIPAVIGVLWAHWMVGGPWVHLAIEPLLVGKGIRPSNSDWMALVDTFFVWRHDRNILFLALEYGVPIVAAAAVAWGMRFRSGLRSSALVQAMTAVYGTAALLLFRHLGYDFVFLVFAFALALKYRRQFVARGALLCVAYFWFLQRIGNVFHLQLDTRFVVFNFLVLALTLFQLTRIRHAEPAGSDPAED